ncbi:MAG: lipoate--protein ligase family protein [Candidatus Rokubacteria bacterium]|nr:lipoate--protein ligase family protein [Candidatus Rokubacteria bacterium]
MIRRLDLGFVTPLRSQAIYHGLGAAMEAGRPDTIVFCAPAEPYFCVGYHQRAADVLDLGLCRRRGWPVLRRRIGGGAVYLDRHQLFYQAIVHRSRAPFTVERVYATYLAAPVLALARLGLAAALMPPNEIEVGGRRIAGTGGGQIGDAMVVVGNVLFDFPDAALARAWRAPSRPFRRLAHDGLRRCLTTLGKELETPPSMEALRDALAAAYAETLGEELVAGDLTAREVAAIEAAERELAARAFVLEGAGRRDAGLKIARGVYVYEGRAASADVRVSLRVRHGVIDNLAVRGADPDAARRFIGRPVAALAPSADARNPADLLGDLLASRPDRR